MEIAAFATMTNNGRQRHAGNPEGIIRYLLMYPQKSARPGTRGKGITSRTLLMPVI